MFNQQQLLFTPGPVPITESVQDAMLDLVYHKHEGFANVHQEVMSHLQTIIGTDGPILIAPDPGLPVLKSSCVDLFHFSRMSWF